MGVTVVSLNLRRHLVLKMFLFGTKALPIVPRNERRRKTFSLTVPGQRTHDSHQCGSWVVALVTVAQPPAQSDRHQLEGDEFLFLEIERCAAQQLWFVADLLRGYQ